MTKAQAQQRPSRRKNLLVRRGAPGLRRLRRRHPSAPASASVVRERGRLVNRLLVVLVLALLLFSLIGLLAAMTSAYALTPPQLSAPSVSVAPGKRHPHPPTPSPTLTVSPSPTPRATPTPVPSPTLAPTPTPRATIPAHATPPIKATVPSARAVGGGGPGPIPGGLSPTSVTGSQTVPQPGAHAILPRLVPVLVIAVGVLLVIFGLTLCIGSLPAGKVKWLLSAAALRQRVRHADLHDRASGTRPTGKPAALIDVLPHATAKRTASRTEVSLSTTSHPVPKRRSLVSAPHFLRSTRLHPLPANKQLPVARESLSPLPAHTSRPRATIRERAREREHKNGKQVSAFPDHR